MGTSDLRASATFSTVADAYARGRPELPPAVLDALGPVTGLRVADIGAGTGIATRPLIERGAAVIAVDPSTAMLARAVDRTPNLATAAADGVRLPFPSGSFDLVTFGQSWHWLDPERRVQEAHRVLRPGGRWAAWWTHARDAAWVDAYWDLVEAACPGARRDHRDIDWGADVATSGRFEIDERVTVAWTRALSVTDQLTENASHSAIAALPPDDRDLLLAELRRTYDEAFPDGLMTIPLETWLWIGTRIG